MKEPLRYLWLLLTLLHTTNPIYTHVCRSVDARNNASALEKLRGCTVVEGFVKVVLMEKSFVEADFDPYSFPELREVTQYMLFYRVQGLRSLGKLFPNLEKIGGADLVQDFALVVYEMFHLREIGLTNLREISKGSVNIVKNPSLCFVDTVKWSNITKWNVVRNYNVHNRDPTSCPGCPDHCRDGACWNTNYCQFEPELATAGAPKCDPLCVGRCHKSGPQGCYTCKGYFDRNGNCLEKCPPNTYEYLNRRCVTRQECTSTDKTNLEDSSDEKRYSGISNDSTNYVIFENKCLESCPSGYELATGGKDCLPCREGRCHKWCKGAVINSTGEAQKLRGCTHISGSIEITIKSETSGAVHSVLEENLGSIEQITGYLQVTRSSVKDLNFLNNLSVIHGNDTNKQNFALVIISNENLQELWDWDGNRNFTVVNGRLYFHYNPKLCLYHIHKLLDVIGYPDKNVSNFEIDKDSNGDKFPCNATEIRMTVTEKTSDCIEVHVPYLEDIPVLRYVIYYTKDPFKNITMFDDFDQCSDFGWRTKDISVIDSNDLNYKKEGFRVNLTELEPYTSYVFYVTTYTIHSVGARSEMYRESTMPTTPSELTRLQAQANSNSEIELQWEPPKQTNGKLQNYVVTWYVLEEDRAFIDQRNYCDHPRTETPERNMGDSEKIRPQVVLENKSCCSAPKYLPKDGFEMLCKNFGKIQLPEGFPDKTKYASCESYFYSYVYNSPNRHGPDTFIQGNHITRKTPNHKKLGRNKLMTYQNEIPADNSIVKNKIKIKSKILPANSKGVVLRDLRNFQNYVINVKACRERDKSEVDISGNDRCSKSEIVTVRTKGIDQFDSIPQQSLLHGVEDRRLGIKWKPPVSPNGLVVAFEIEYRKRDLEDPTIRKECLTHIQYENNNRQYYIDSLNPGKYKFRIRAVSLYGKGPFTNFISFDIEDKKTYISLLEIIVIVLAFLIFLFIIYISSYFYKPSKYNIVIADVNPNYHYVPDHYEIDRDDVELGRELGSGSFGKVYEGLWKSKNLRCAIKTVNEDATMENENEFLIEASVMKTVTNAYFIVQLFGVVSRGRPPLVLMELMERGDLKTYLREVREENPITNAIMIKMALEIADGMSFMEAKKFVHRDLAARNCMVSSELTIKVGDFGMARDIYETDYYRKKNQGFLPIRWMAPESLKDGEFTSQSDIWSYGVVLWEIVTMAQQPYQGSSNDQVLHQVISGRRLEIPKVSPLPLKSLMKLCWKVEPASRSSFMNIVRSLEYYHDEEFKRVAYYHSQEAVAIRESMWEYVEMQPVTDPLLAPRTASFRLATVHEE